jgi:hypothetical protein
MEELQSTEVLHREILEDARKKAYRILKGADEAVRAGVTAWEKKTDDAVTEVRELYAQRILITREELNARLVLDKRRIRSEKIEGLLKSSMETYLLNLRREILVSILDKTLQKQLDELQRTGEFPQKAVKVRSHKIENTELEAILTKYLPQGSWDITVGDSDLASLAFEPGKEEERFPAIVLDASTVRVIASIDAITADLLEDKRAELVASLLGPEALLEGEAV